MSVIFWTAKKSSCVLNILKQWLPANHDEIGVEKYKLPFDRSQKDIRKALERGLDELETELKACELLDFVVWVEC